jgi:hypothetical protein
VKVKLTLNSTQGKKNEVLDELAEKLVKAKRKNHRIYNNIKLITVIFNYYSSSSCSEAPIVPLVASVNTGPNVAPLSLLTLITGVSLV